jgi:hypothetical protein
MKRFYCSMVLIALAVAPGAAQSQMMSASMYGLGPHGFDWVVGTWSCTNTMPSPMGGPARTTLRVIRTSSGAIFYRSIGTGFDNSWYNVYSAKTKSWTSPFIVSDGSYGTETTSQTGRTIVWTGMAYDASGKMMRIRDTNVNSPKRYSDLGEVWSGGTWKTQYNVTCVRS